MAKIELTYNDQVHHFECSESENILEAGLNAGIDLPYSCRAGICTACKAHVSFGKTHLDGADALDEDEIKDSFVLSCCAFPRSEEVKLNFDV